MPNDFLYPANPNAKEFFQYFCHHWDFITAPVGTKDWQTIKNYKLQPRVLWRRFQDSQKLLGVRFGQYTKYGMVDLDRTSLLHFFNNPQAFNDLCAAFEVIGLCRFVILFSSWSSGLHIYFPLPDEVNSFDLACALRMAVEGAGFKVKGGQLELFPNTKLYKENQNGTDFSHFNGHRLPLQPNTGSRLLDDDLAPYSEGLEDFLDQMNWAAQNQDMGRLRDVLSISRDWYYQRKYRFIRTSSKSKVREWQEDTEFLINEGFTDFGQTNDLIREIGKYGRVFKALEGIELQQYMVETITNLPGYKQYCRHQPEIVRKCHHWARIIEPFWWALGTNPTRHTSYQEINEKGQQTVKNSQLNLERATDCQERLKQTLAYLIKQAVTLPKKVGERLQLLRETSKKLFGKAFSERTLKKLAYLPLWHPKFDKERPEPENADIRADSETQDASEASESNSEKNNKSNIVQEDIQLQTNPVEESKVQITPPDVVRQPNCQAKPSKTLPNGQINKIDHTSPYMKGYETDAEFSEDLWADDTQEVTGTENDNLQIQEKEKFKNNHKFNPEDITKTYGQESTENRSKQDKNSLSEAQKNYYQEFLARHPDWKTLDEDRRNPEYQKKIKTLFAEVKEILKRKSRKSNLDRQDE